jgi:hypothetical protein
MENGKQGAFSSVDLDNQHFQVGLTKREYFAGLAMQGLMSNPEFIKVGTFDFKYNKTAERVSSISIKVADELLKQIEI